uniref:NADH dehydrogenase subunit 3 n=1 Tax=Barbatia decussata TaxID=1508519 RepID=UPI002028E95C|nr:NADH dehydrogenase subunit 3 [Barbatia decussata]UQT66006.1 NADH dehydrogenase subunit 3 [Barbatia decussata]
MMSVGSRFVGVCLMVSIIFCLGLLASSNSKVFREGNSPYECGFEPIGSARSAFSLRFFMMVMVFLVFDVELVLLLPMVVEVSSVGWSSSLLLQLGLFLSLLLGGLWFEWSEGSLSWL